MLRQAFIEERVVRLDESAHAAILAQHAVEEELGFLPEGLPQVVVEVPKKIGAWNDRVDIAQPQPLSGEIRREVERAAIGEHPARLLLELSGLTQLAPNGGVEQLIVRDAAPQEERQSRRQFEIADSVDTARRYFLRVAFHAEQELRVGEHSAQRRCDSSVEIAFGAPFAIEGHRLVNVGFGDRPPIGAPHQRR